jgi:hypothetical protein
MESCGGIGSRHGAAADIRYVQSKIDLGESHGGCLGSSRRRADSDRLQNNSEQRDLARQIAALGETSYAELQTLWSQHFRYRAPKKLAREQLELGIAWKLQAQLRGGLNAATRRRLNDLAHMLVMNADSVQKRTITLKPGARLLRAWGGETHEVFVTEDGFLWRGKTWASLSIIAREITGARWSGPRFFGLGMPTKQEDDGYA